MAQSMFVAYTIYLPQLLTFAIVYTSQLTHEAKLGDADWIKFGTIPGACISPQIISVNFKFTTFTTRFLVFINKVKIDPKQVEVTKEY